MRNDVINEEQLTEEIIALINTKKEGVYWDFKTEHHTCNAELLADILCMANSMHRGHRYIIFGIGNTYEIIGLENNNKTQASILDMLSKINFAGGHKPETELRKINIDNKNIDVLIIFDNPFKPYYITEDYIKTKKRSKTQQDPIPRKDEKSITVHAGIIYGRVGDKNTPLNAFAEFNQIEKMWRQRFGLDIAIFDQLLGLLKNPEEWESYGRKTVTNGGRVYHGEYPLYFLHSQFH